MFQKYIYWHDKSASGNLLSNYEITNILKIQTLCDIDGKIINETRAQFFDNSNSL